MSDNFWESEDNSIVSRPRPGVAAHWNGDNEVTIRVMRIREGNAEEDLVSVPPEALRDLARHLEQLATRNDTAKS